MEVPLLYYTAFRGYVHFMFSNNILPTTCISNLGPVVQSNVSLTSLLRGQLVKCFTTV